LEDLGIEGDDNTNIYLQKVLLGDIKWIDLANDSDRWQTLVNVVMKLRGISSLDEDLLDSQEALYSVELVIRFVNL
jgi:hypothetical protein